MLHPCIIKCSLFVAKIIAQEIRKLLKAGDDEVLSGISLATEGTAGGDLRFVEEGGKCLVMAFSRSRTLLEFWSGSEQGLEMGWGDETSVWGVWGVGGGETGDLTPARAVSTDACKKWNFEIFSSRCFRKIKSL